MSRIAFAADRSLCVASFLGQVLISVLVVVPS